MKIWHYTVGSCLRSIIKDRTIRLATEGVPPHQRPVVWATTRPKWEPTANEKLLRVQDGQTFSLGKLETAAHCEGLYRIELLPEAAPYGWDEYKRLSHIDEGMAKALARRGREQGSNYRDWRVSFEPISADKWLRIEIDVGKPDQWTEISMNLVTAWTRPVMEKGCPVCSETEERKGRPWRYMPDPHTGEPRSMCDSCYSVIEQAVTKKED